ncbi:putative RNA-directed DNA polymerase [Helianthus annuus]|nr:putative RNA-directed DNA polymerase [Helianthus annuus]
MAGDDQSRTKSNSVADNLNQSSPIPGLNHEKYEQFISSFTNDEIIQWMENMGARLGDDGNWIIDSGCTEHKTYLLNLFHGNLKTTRELPVRIPNGDSIPVKGKGSSTLPNGTEIRDVLYVPDFTCNLLSVSRLTRDLDCTMVERERKAMSASVEVWHKRLGHASSGKLSHFDFVKNVSFKTINCDSCAKAKHTQLPFPISSIKTKECFELLHCDLWGRYRTPSLSRANYFLTIVDDYSRSVWVILLRHKFDAGDHLIFFHKMIKTQFGKSIKRIRCNNGGGGSLFQTECTTFMLKRA